jgi:hypothetical protein
VNIKKLAIWENYLKKCRKKLSLTNRERVAELINDSTGYVCTKVGPKLEHVSLKKFKKNNWREMR